MVGMDSINGWAAGASTTALGLNQYYKGKKMLKNNKRPEYQIPEEVRQNLSQANLDALNGLPQEQQQQFINNLQRSSSSALSGLGSRKAGLSGIAAINQNQNDAYGNLLSMNSQARMANKQNLAQQRGIMGDYRDQAFQINKMNPYYEKQAEGLALKGAGMQNIGNSFQIAQGKGGDFANKNAYEGMGQNPNQGNQMSSQYWGNQKMAEGGMNNYNPYSNSGGMATDNAYSSSGFGNNVG